MTTPIPNYSKMAQLWAKDRAKGYNAETAKKKRVRYAALTIIDEIDDLISQNEVLWRTLKWKMIRGHQKLMLHVLECHYKMQCLLKARKDDW